MLTVEMILGRYDYKYIKDNKYIKIGDEKLWKVYIKR